MKIYTTIQDVISENGIVMAEDTIAVLNESENTFTINIKKEDGFDLTDKDFTIDLPKSFFTESNFKFIDELKEEENLEEENIEQDYVDPEAEKNKKKMITQIVDKSPIQNEINSEVIPSTASKKVKDDTKKKMENFKSVKSIEEQDLRESISKEITKIVKLIESEEISPKTKDILTKIMETFLVSQIKKLSETFDERLQNKIMEIEEAKEKEMNDWVLSEKTKINNYVDYVSREIMMEMKKSFVDEAIVEESLNYRTTLNSLKEKFDKISKSYNELVETNKKIQEANKQTNETVKTLKENNTKLRSKVDELIKFGLIRDITEGITESTIVKKIEESAKSINAKTNEEFFNLLKLKAKTIVKESERQKIIDRDNKRVLREEKETVNSTDSSPIFENKKKKDVVDTYVEMMNG